jgi:hypothetical protein
VSFSHVVTANFTFMRGSINYKHIRAAAQIIHLHSSFSAQTTSNSWCVTDFEMKGLLVILLCAS